MRFTTRNLLVVTTVAAYYLAIVTSATRAAEYEGATRVWLSVFVTCPFVVLTAVGAIRAGRTLLVIPHRYRLVAHVTVIAFATVIAAASYLRLESPPADVCVSIVLLHFWVEVLLTVRICQNGLHRMGLLRWGCSTFSAEFEAGRGVLYYRPTDSEKAIRWISFPADRLPEVRAILAEKQPPGEEPS